MPANITKEVEKGLATAVAIWEEPSATDNSGSPTLTSSYSPGSSFSIGVISVEYTAVDSNGNTATETFIVEIVEFKGG